MRQSTRPLSTHRSRTSGTRGPQRLRRLLCGRHFSIPAPTGLRLSRGLRTTRVVASCRRRVPPVHQMRAFIHHLARPYALFHHLNSTAFDLCHPSCTPPTRCLQINVLTGEDASGSSFKYHRTSLGGVPSSSGHGLGQSNVASRTPRARRTTCKRRSLSEAAEEGGGKQSVSLTRAGSTGSIDSSADSTSVTEKKSRFVWEPEVHKRFCEAVHKLGVLAAKPQAIAQLMQVHPLPLSPSLSSPKPYFVKQTSSYFSRFQMEGPGAPTRQNIKSHLQKYRIYLAKQKHMGDPATSLAAVKSPQEIYDAPQRVDSEEDPIVASFGK